MARYFVKEHDREDAEDMVRLVEETINIIDKVVSERR